MAVNFDEGVSAIDVYKYAPICTHPEEENFMTGTLFSQVKNTFSKKWVFTDTLPGNAV